MDSLANGPIPFGMLLKVMYDQAEGGKPPAPVYSTTDDMIRAGDLVLEKGRVGLATAEATQPAETSLPERAVELVRHAGAVGIEQGGTALSWVKNHIQG